MHGVWYFSLVNGYLSSFAGRSLQWVACPERYFTQVGFSYTSNSRINGAAAEMLGMGLVKSRAIQSSVARVEVLAA